MMDRRFFAVAALLMAGIQGVTAAQVSSIKEPEPPKPLPEGAVV